LEELLASIQSSELKKIAQDIVFANIGSFGDISVKPSFFTLPSAACDFEEMLFKFFAGRVHLVGVESSAQIHEIAVKNIKQKNIQMELHPIKDDEFWAKSPPQPFDVIWLDYMGPWSESVLPKLDCLCKRGFLRFLPGHNPRLMVTFRQGREKMFAPLVQIAMDSAKHISKEESRKRARIGSIPFMMNSVMNDSLFSLETKFIFRYKDYARSNKAAIMTMFIMEIHKGIKDFDYWNVKVMNSVLSNDGIPH
jgi:hypothetical protein